MRDSQASAECLAAGVSAAVVKQVAFLHHRIRPAGQEWGTPHSAPPSTIGIAIS